MEVYFRWENILPNRSTQVTQMWMHIFWECNLSVFAYLIDLGFHLLLIKHFIGEVNAVSQPYNIDFPLILLEQKSTKFAREENVKLKLSL
jgi:hypothetical protein